MAIVIRKRIAIPLYVEDEVSAHAFVKFPPQETLARTEGYKSLSAEYESPDDTSLAYLSFISEYLVGWDNLYIDGDEPLEFNCDNKKEVATLIAQDERSFDKFFEAMKGITEKK